MLRSQAHLQVAQAVTRPKPAKELAYSNTRTEKYAAKMKDRITNDKNGQLVTRYIKNWADTTEIKGCSSLQTLYRLDSDVLRSAQLFIYRNRYGQL
jgi:hypothetical protein